MNSIEELLLLCKKNKIRCVAIGASAGGVDALLKVLPAFKKPSQVSVLVVLHILPQSESLLPLLLKDSCDFQVKEATSAEDLLPETIYIAPSDYHMCLEPDWKLGLSSEEPLNFSRPSIDVLFDSVAYSARDRGLGVLLTGSNQDGTKGLEMIRDQGGVIFVQSPDEAEYPEMPASVVSRLGNVPVFKLAEITSLFSAISSMKDPL